jgi:hypothetical protein
MYYTFQGGHGVAEEHQEHAHRYLEGDEVDNESVSAAKFGCSIMGGFLLPMIFGIIFHRPRVIEDEKSVVSEGDAECLSCIERDAAAETGAKNSADSEGYANFLSLVKQDAAVETGADSLPMPISDVKKNDDIPQDGHEHCDICDENHNAANVYIQESVRTVEKVFINKQLCASILLGDAFITFRMGCSLLLHSRLRAMFPHPFPL